MGMTLAEIILLVAALFVLYRLLSPLRRRVEKIILGVLDPKTKRIIDVKPSDIKEKK